MTPREKHVQEMQRLAMAIRKTKSDQLKQQYTKRLRKMSHELKIYDSYRRKQWKASFPFSR